MVNYRDGKIYKIVSNQTDQVYFGSTTNSLTRRLTDHRAKYKNYQKGIGRYITSFTILKFDDAQIILVEDYPSERKDHLHARERFFIESHNCVNKYIPNRTKREYDEANREKIKEYGKEYRDTNKEQIKGKNKEYYQNNKQKINQKISCPTCSGQFTTSNKTNHARSAKHKNAESNSSDESD
jgi:hypothetical protein